MDQSLDIVFRNRATQTVGRLTLLGGPDTDPITFAGEVMDSSGQNSIGLAIEAYDETIQATPLTQTTETDFAFLDEDGATESGYGVRSYGAYTFLEDRYQIDVGTYFDTEGNEYDVFAISDPVPPIVWIVAIAAAACVLVIGIEALTADCKSNTATAVQECAASGGHPKIHAKVNYGIGYESGKFRMGCYHECTVDCSTS